LYLLKARTVEPEKQPLLGNARNNRGIVGNVMQRVEPLLWNYWVNTFPGRVSAQEVLLGTVLSVWSGLGGQVKSSGAVPQFPIHLHGVVFICLISAFTLNYWPFYLF
jgi:hypothetical protein